MKTFILTILLVFSFGAVAFDGVFTPLGKPHYTPTPRQPITYTTPSNPTPRFGVATVRTSGASIGRTVLKSLLSRNPYWIAATIAAGYFLDTDGIWKKETPITNGYWEYRSTSGSLKAESPEAYLEAFFQSQQQVYPDRHNFTLENWESEFDHSESSGTKSNKFFYSFEYLSSGNTSTRNQSSIYYNFVEETTIQVDEFTSLEAADLYLARMGITSGSDVLTPEAFMKPGTTEAYPDLYESVSPMPQLSPALSKALIALATGLHQTTNPQAEHYISPEMLPKVQTALQSALNNQPFYDPYTDTVVDPVDEPLPDPDATPNPNPQPLPDVNVNVEFPDFDMLTQTQYEQSNEKWQNELATGLPEVQQEWNQHQDDYIQSVQDIESISPPAEIFDLNSLWNIGTGSCIGYSDSLNLSRHSITLQYDKHCPAYDAWGRALVAWFMSIVTALYIFHLWDKTVLQTAV